MHSIIILQPTSVNIFSRKSIIREFKKLLFFNFPFFCTTYIIFQIYTTDITKQLDEYKVEYQVLQEEMVSVQPQVEAIHKLEAQNKILTERNKTLMGQLDLSVANVQRLEKTRVLQQAQLNRLEMQSRGLDVTIAALGNFINNLIEEKVN